MEDGIRTDVLCKRYGGQLVVDHLSLSIPRGCCFALLGMNGAGKSTTLRMLSGLTVPDSGDAYLAGHSIRKETLAAKMLQSVSPQETAVAPNLTVKENLELMAALKFKNTDKRRERVQSCKEQFSLQEVWTKRAKTLSGGFQRRLSIAMALVSQPEILFLDEPTLGLDVLSRRELWSLLQGLKGKITVILTTHYLEEAEALADQVGIMAKGRLYAAGSVDELCRQTGRASLEEAFLACIKEAEI